MGDGALAINLTSFPSERLFVGWLKAVVLHSRNQKCETRNDPACPSGVENVKLPDCIPGRILSWGFSPSYRSQADLILSEGSR